MEFLQEAQKDLNAAQSMVDSGIAKDEAEALSIIKAKKKEAVEETQKDISEGEETMSDNDEVEKRVAKMEQVLQDFGKFFVDYKKDNVGKLTELSEQVTAFRKELLSVKSELQKLVAVVPVEKLVEFSKEEVEPKETNTDKKIADDVAVDKIFNNAHNRLIKR